MPNQQLTEYIKQQLTAGISRDAITAALVAQGWKIEDINQAFLVLAPLQASSAQASTPVQSESKTNPKKKSNLRIILVAVLLVIILIGGGYVAYGFIIRSLNDAQQQALDTKQKLEAIQKANEEAINNTLNGTDNSSSTVSTSTVPTASSAVTYDSTWTTFSYQSKNPKLPSFSFKYPSSLGKPVVDDSKVATSNDNFGGPIHIVFHAQHSDDKTPYSYVTDHALKNLDIYIATSYVLPDEADKTLPMLQSMAKYLEDSFHGLSYYFNIGTFKAAGVRYSIQVSNTIYYNTNYEIDLNKQPSGLFGLTVSDGNAPSAPKYNTDFDSSNLSTADKIVRSISF